MAEGRYVRVATKLWLDEKVRTLSENGRILYLYILTSPHSNMAGYYYLPEMYIAHDLQWSEKRVSGTLRELFEKGLINRCPDTSVTHIPNYLKYNPIQNENQAKGANKRLKELPKTPLIKELEKSCESFTDGLFEVLFEGIETSCETPSEGFEKGSEPPTQTPSNTVTVSVTGTEDIYAESAREIYEHWIQKAKHINNAKFTKNLEDKITTKLKKWNKETIKRGIDNYVEIYNSDYYYSHKFSLFKIIEQGNGLPRFIGGLDEKHDGDIWEDYLKNKKSDKTKTGFEHYREV